MIKMICLFFTAAGCASLDYNTETRRLFIGLDNGTISVSLPISSIFHQLASFFSLLLISLDLLMDLTRYQQTN